MNLRIRHVARGMNFRGIMLAKHGVNPDDWDLSTYSDAAYAWMREVVMSSENGEKQWRKVEAELWAGYEHLGLRKKAAARARQNLAAHGLIRQPGQRPRR